LYVKNLKQRPCKYRFDDLPQEGKQLLGGEKLGDTRQVTQSKRAKQKSAVKRANTMQKVVAEGIV
jgi:hypothetical protein